MQLDAAIEIFSTTLAGENYSPETIRLYRWMLNEMMAYVGNKDVEKIRAQDLSGFMAHMRTSYHTRKGRALSNSTLDNCWKSIRCFFNWAVKELSIERPDAHLNRPKFETEPVKPFSIEEVQKLLDACDKTQLKNPSNRAAYKQRRPSARRDKALILMLADTGCRIGEVCRLKIQDVNLKSGDVTIAAYNAGRKTHGRTVYLSSKTTAALLRYLGLDRKGAHPEDPLFMSVKTNRPLNKDTVGQLFDRLASLAGVADVHPHRFRHTFAIEFLRGGGDALSLQRLLGHRTLEMVNHYVLLAADDTKNAHRRASPLSKLKV